MLRDVGVSVSWIKLPAAQSKAAGARLPGSSYITRQPDYITSRYSNYMYVGIVAVSTLVWLR